MTLTARYRSPTAFEYVHEQCYDLSGGGMFIKSSSPAPAGTLLKLECDVDRGDAVPQVISGVARVVWQRDQVDESGQPIGMGVKFVKLDPGSREIIDGVLAQVGTNSGSADERRTAEEFSAPLSESKVTLAEIAAVSAPPLPQQRSRPAELQSSAAARGNRTLLEAAGPGPQSAGDGRRTDPEFNPMPPGVRATAPDLGSPARDSATPESEGTSGSGPFTHPDRSSSMPASLPPLPPSDGDATDPGWRAQRLRELVAAQGASGPGVQGGRVREVRERSKPRISGTQMLLASLVVLGAVGLAAVALRGPPKSSPQSTAGTVGQPTGLEPIAPARPSPGVPDSHQLPPASALDSKEPSGALPEDTNEPDELLADEGKREQPVPTPAREPSRRQPVAEEVREKSTTERRAEPRDVERKAEAVPQADPPPEPDPVAQAEVVPEDQPAAEPPLTVAMRCLSAGDNACVVATLAGKAKTAKELELLIETYRAMGRAADAQPLMERYVSNFPQERRANSYRRMIDRREREQAESAEQAAGPSSDTSP